MKKCGQTTFNMYAHIDFHIPFPGFYHGQKMLKDLWWERTSSKISARSQLAQLGIKCIYLLDEVTHIRWKGEETQNQIKSVRMGCVDVFKITRKSDYLLELVPSLTAMPIVTFFHRSKLYFYRSILMKHFQYPKWNWWGKNKRLSQSINHPIH